MYIQIFTLCDACILTYINKYMHLTFYRVRFRFEAKRRFSITHVNFII